MSNKHATPKAPSWSPDLVNLYVELFDKYVAFANSILRDRGVAEECVQEAFLRYHEKGVQPAPGCERSYLRSMVRNGALSKLRTEARLAGAEPTDSQLRAEPSAETKALASLVFGEVASRLSVLPSRQRKVIDLRFEGLSVVETAQVMAISSGSVKTHRHRAASAMQNERAYLMSA